MFDRVLQTVPHTLHVGEAAGAHRTQPASGMRFQPIMSSSTLQSCLTLCCTGPHPPEWGQDQSLKTLSLLDTRYTGISGPLPDSWGSQLSTLGALQSTDNKLTGAPRSGCVWGHTPWDSLPGRQVGLALQCSEGAGHAANSKADPPFAGCEVWASCRFWTARLSGFPASFWPCWSPAALLMREMCRKFMWH